MLFIPIHFAYLALIVLAIIPNTITTVNCSKENNYPYIMMASVALFALVYIISVAIHASDYLVKWDLKTG